MKLFIVGLAGLILGAILGYALVPVQTRIIVMGAGPDPIVFTGSGDMKISGVEQ